MTQQFGKQISYSVELVITAGAYVADDVVGGLITLGLTTAGGGGIIRRVRIFDADDEKADLDLYFFDSLPAAIADNAAFAGGLASADKMAHIKKVAVAAADYVSIASEAIAIKDGLEIDFSGAVYLYIVTATGSTPTYTATDDLTIYVDGWGF